MYTQYDRRSNRRGISTKRINAFVRVVTDCGQKSFDESIRNSRRREKKKMANIKVQIPTVKRRGWMEGGGAARGIHPFFSTHYRVSLFSYVYVCRVI